MATERCSLCSKSAERAALVRCSDARCPLARTPQRASPKVLFGMGLAGLAGVAAIFGVASLANGKSTERAAPAQAAVAASVHGTGDASYATVDAGNRSAAAWLTKLFAAPRPERPEFAAADEPDSGVSDPRAATRVQSFGCAGVLSTSRSLVCTRWDLATADYNLMLSYKAALAHARNPRALRRARAAWLKQLDALGGDATQILRHIEAFQRMIATA